MKTIAILTLIFCVTEHAVPTDAKLAEAEKSVREIYAKDLERATTLQLKLLLAKRLLNDAETTNDDLAGKFVLLRSAREISALAGDVQLVREACEQMVSQFAVTRTSCHAESIKLLAKAKVVPQQFVDFVMDAAKDAVEVDRYRDALDMLKQAESIARRDSNKNLLKTIVAEQKRISALEVEYPNVLAAKMKLESKPLDPSANAIVGRFYCVLVNDWGKGLSPLALSNDPLAPIAQTDLKRPDKFSEQLALADQWWDADLQLRAAYWYRKALPEVNGLTRKKIESRLAQMKDQTHYFSTANPGDMLFVAWENNNWNNDVSSGFRLIPYQSGYKVQTAFKDGYPNRMIVFPKIDPEKHVFSTSFTLREGNINLDLRPKDLAHAHSRVQYTFKPNVRYTVEMWVNGGRPKSRVNGVEVDVEDNPKSLGVYAFTVSRTISVEIHSVSFHDMDSKGR